MKVVYAPNETYNLTVGAMCVGCTFQLKHVPHQDYDRDDIYLMVKNPYPGDEVLKRHNHNKHYVVNLNHNKVCCIDKTRACKIVHTQVEIVHEEC